VPNEIHALERSIETHIASLEANLNRLDQPIADLDPIAKRSLQARYRDLLAEAHAAQNSFHTMVEAFASASSLEGNCSNTGEHHHD
jgi:hypothetical protein